jgi:hypothetical protein
VLDLSIEKLFILAVVALFVLGPERLPPPQPGSREPYGRSKPTPTMRITRSVASSAQNSTRSAHRTAPLPTATRRLGTDCEPAARQPTTTAARRRGTPTHRPRRDLSPTSRQPRSASRGGRSAPPAAAGNGPGWVVRRACCPPRGIPAGMSCRPPPWGDPRWWCCRPLWRLLNPR